MSSNDVLIDDIEYPDYSHYILTRTTFLFLIEHKMYKTLTLDVLNFKWDYIFSKHIERQEFMYYVNFLHSIYKTIISIEQKNLFRNILKRFIEIYDISDIIDLSNSSYELDILVSISDELDE
jgi:hypothetical protein